MICSKCGKEIPEGKLYCSFCGEEVYMVPDFEPEIENEIEESLSSLVQDFTENDQKENKKRIGYYKKRNDFHSLSNVFRTKFGATVFYRIQIKNQ